MPIPKSGESQSDFIARCIPIVIEDGTATDTDQAVAICTSIWQSGKQTMRIKELSMNKDSGVFAISMVDEPAIEMDFLYFSKQHKNVEFATADFERMVITGPAMIPDKMIYRVNEETDEEFYVYFTKETVRSIAEQYLLNNRQYNVTLQHEVPIEDICLIESWIVEDPQRDKAITLGYNVPKGTWMISMKVNNKKAWNKLIKTGEVRGFSIEGAFLTKFKKANFNERELTDEQILDKIKQLISEVE
jgi:hypothetical protein